MVDTPSDDNAFDEEAAAFHFESLQEASQRLGLPVDFTRMSQREVTFDDLIWILDRFPFVQLTDGDEKAEPLPEVKVVSAPSSGWDIHNYGNAMSSSPGRLLFGSSSSDDDEGSGGLQVFGTIIRQRYMTARDMVALAIKQGWGAVYIVDGHPKMMRDVWIESQAQGITVIGYEPTEADIATRDRIQLSADAMVAKRSRPKK